MSYHEFHKAHCIEPWGGGNTQSKTSNNREEMKMDRFEQLAMEALIGYQLDSDAMNKLTQTEKSSILNSVTAMLQEVDRIAREEEREECIKIFEYPSRFVDPLFDTWNEPPEEAIKAIRARGNK